MAPQQVDPGRRFGGIARLYGRSGLERLTRSRVCVVGVGGVGSWAAEALARSAVGGIDLIDLDHVAESNVNRQLHALEETLGRAKVQVLAERIRAINPGCRVEAVEEFVDPDNLERLITGDHDYVVDCIDAWRTKAALIAHCRRRRTPVITVGAAGGQLDPLRIRMADLSRTLHDPLLAKTRKQLRREYGFSRNPKRRFEVPAVYSMEQSRYPTVQGGVCRDRPGRSLQGLSCAGFGAVMTVTATFGLVAVSHVLKRLARVDLEEKEE